MPVKFLFILILLFLFSCEKDVKEEFVRKGVKSQVKKGKILMTSFGCINCHYVPGLKGNPRYIGPSLKGWAHRKYITGRVANNRKNLVKWIQDPSHVQEKSAMPSTPMTQMQAQAIADFLYSLK